MLDAGSIRAFFAERAAAVDRAELDVRDGLRWLARHGLLDLNVGWRARADAEGLSGIGQLISLVAEECLASAFALWSQRMVIEYVGAATQADFPREQLLSRLLEVDLLGSTALGNGMAHLVIGVPLALRLERDGGELVLNGSVAWASNLLQEPDATLMVVAAEDHGGGRWVVGVPLDARGVKLAEYPRLLALQATRSTSLELHQVRVPAHLAMASLDACLPTVRPTLLVLQSCFCQGLARASLRAAAAHSQLGVNSIFAEDVAKLEAELLTLERCVSAQLRRPDVRLTPMRELVAARQAAARLAGSASRLEWTLRGGRAFRMNDAANRRFREAAFLAIQAPTEAQLAWELARRP